MPKSRRAFVVLLVVIAVLLVLNLTRGAGAQAKPPARQAVGIAAAAASDRSAPGGIRVFAYVLWSDGTVEHVSTR